MTSCAKVNVLSLYRSTLRVAGKLPHPYLSFFHRLHAGHYFRVNRTASGELLQRKLQRARKTLGRLEAACIGKQRAFEQILHQAYGRTGRLRWELMQTHLSDPRTPRPEPIIPGVDRSRPPTYSPTLQAILGAAVAKSTDNVHTPAQLKHPHTLPARANPQSEDARLLGPFSLRRQVNIRWRFFSQQRDLTWWPLEVDWSALVGMQTNPSHSAPSTGFEGLGMVQEIGRLATQSGERRHSKSLQQDALREQGATTNAVLASLPLPSKLPTRSRRWVRRRYHILLAKIPALIAQPSNKSDKGESAPQYIVRRSSEVGYVQGQGQRRTTTSEETEWIRRANEAAATMKGLARSSPSASLSRNLRRVAAAEAEAATGLRVPRKPSAVNKRS